MGSRLTEHFTFEELTDSSSHPGMVAVNRQAALTDLVVMDGLRSLAELLELIRAAAGRYFHRELVVRVTSGFRCHQLNALVGGSATSQHRLGQAADWYLVDPTDGNMVDPKLVFGWLVLSGLSRRWHQCYLDVQRHFIHVGVAIGREDGQWWYLLPNGARVKEV